MRLYMRSFFNRRSFLIRPCRVIGFRIVVCVAFALSSTSELAGQTLFARPDTTPNYASYRHLEDCQVAALRLTDEQETRKDTIWYDTAEYGIREAHKRKLETSRRPDTAMRVASVCLNQFNADTAQIQSLNGALYIVQVLLVTHRDQDAQRFAQRVLDSMRHKPDGKLRDALSGLMAQYGNARPVRLREAKHYYGELLIALKPDSLYRTIDAARFMADVANRIGDTALFEEAAWHAIRTNDATPVKERLSSWAADKRLPTLVGLLSLLTKEEGLDSIAISTVAYKMYQSNTLRVRVYGEEARRTEKEIELFKVPDVVGEHYYVASNASSTATSQGLAPYTNKGAVPHGEIPVRNRINLIYSLQSFCHAEGLARKIDFAKMRGDRGSSGGCMKGYAMLRRLKQRFPDLEFTALSSTYGTVGQLGPLPPAEEADTLAKLWLGFHHLPQRLVVEERPFFHVADPDGRRIDLPTPYANTLQREATFPLEFLTDKEGRSVRAMGDMGSDLWNRFVKILMQRASK